MTEDETLTLRITVIAATVSVDHHRPDAPRRKA